MKTIKFIIIALVFFAVGFFLGQSYQWPNLTPEAAKQPLVQEQKITYSLQFSDSDRIEFHDIQLLENQTVLEILRKLAAENSLVLEVKNFEGIGSMITKIGDKANGQENKYWQYFINGAYAQIGADQYKLKDGDAVEWKFSADQFNQ